MLAETVCSFPLNGCPMFLGWADLHPAKVNLCNPQLLSSEVLYQQNLPGRITAFQNKPLIINTYARMSHFN